MKMSSDKEEISADQIVKEESSDADKLEWKDISSEEWRKYEWADFTILINYPQKISISKNGHRVLDITGVSHYIPVGWRYLTWKADPPFVF